MSKKAKAALAALAAAAVLIAVCVVLFRPAWAESIEQLTDLPDIVESRQITDFGQEDFQSDSVVYDITYLSDGLKIKGFVGAPKDYLEKKYPILIYNHGSEILEAAKIAQFSDLGFIVVASQYRSSNEGKYSLGGDDVRDVIKVIDIAEQLSFADTENMFMIGVSTGGMMTYLVCREDDRVNAAVSIGGIADAFAHYGYRVDSAQRIYERILGGTPEEVPEEYEARSAVCWADEIQVPLLILHGQLDTLVDFSESEDLAAALEKAGKKYKLITFPDELHVLSYEAWYPPVMDWFEQHSQ